MYKIQKTNKGKAQQQHSSKPSSIVDDGLFTLLDDSTDSFAICVDGKFYWINKAFATLFGYKNEELIGKELDALIVPHKRVEFTQYIKQLSKDNKVSSITTTAKQKNNDEIDIKILIREISIEGKKAISLKAEHIITKDSTQTELQNEYRFYQSVLDNSSDIVVIINLDGTLRYESPSLDGLLGYSSDEVMGSSTFEFIHPDSVSIATEAIDKLIKYPESPVQVEVQVQHKNGSWHTIEVTGKNFIDDPVIGGIIANFHDITDRKKAEEATKEAENRYRAIFDNHIQMVYIHDELGHFLDANDYALETMGLNRDDMAVKSFADFVHPDDLPMAMEVISNIMANGYMDQSVELRIIKPSGELIWIDTYCIPLEVSAEHYIGIGIVHDITERKNAEIALQQNEERYRIFAENITDAIWTMDMNLRYTYYSPVIKKMRGYTPEEVISMSLSESMTPASVEVAMQVFTEELANEQKDDKDLTRSRTMELELYCKDKPNIWTEICVTFLRDENGEATGILGITRDISERITAENTLNQRTQQILALQEITTYMQSTLDLEEVLQRISEAVVLHMGFHIAMIFLADETGEVHRGTVYYPNDDESIQLVLKTNKIDQWPVYSVADVENTLGVPITQIKIPIIRGYSQVVDNCLDRKETVVHNFYELAEPMLSRDTCDTIQKLLAAKTIVDVPFYSKDKLLGSIVAYTNREDIGEADLEPLRLLAAHAGIAIENAKLNEDLEQRVEERTKQLQAVNKELESFAYSVSHDLRSPLRSIDGFSQVLLEDYGDKLEDEGRENLNRIRGASQRMAQLIEAILQLSRLTRGEMRLKTINLSTMVESISKELEHQDTERNVEFIIQPDLVVEGDEQLLNVAIENLLGNAWKFTRNKENARIEFGYYTDGYKPAYFVRDNGAGFDMEYAEKLFGAFQRLHTKTEFEGTGIGLATVQRIINRHGGEVWAESDIDKGATFYFTL